MSFKFSTKAFALSALSATTLALFASGAQAAGFYIQEQSTSAQGRSFAGSAAFATDASTVYFNPAGMTQLERAQITGGVSVLFPKSKLTDTGTTVTAAGRTAPIGSPLATSVLGLDANSGNGGNPYDPTPVPSLYAAMPVNAWEGSNMWLGIGFSAPFGLVSEYNEDYFARFDSTKTDLKVYNFAPSIAIKPAHWLSLGAGVDIQYADATLEQAQYLGAAGEGTTKMAGDSWEVGYNIGAIITPMDGTDFGVHYRSGVSHTLEGNLRLRSDNGLITPLDVGATADLDLPDMATISLAQRLTDRTTLLGSATWFGWSNFKEIAPKTKAPGPNPAPVIQDYQDTWAFSIGVEHELNNDWTVRAGYQFDETPTTDQYRTTRTPDGDRNWFSAGASYDWSDNITLDLAATYIKIADQDINLRRAVTPTGTVTSDIRAKSEGHVGIVAVGLSYKF